MQHAAIADPSAYAAPPQTAGTNVPGVIAISAAIAGFVFACIPVAFIIGWLLLPIAFIMGIVALFVRNGGKGLGIAAIIVSVVGTIVGVMVFIGFVVDSMDETFSGGDVTIESPSESAEGPATAETEAEPTEKAGTRANPLPLGTAITQGDWTVTVNGGHLTPTEAVKAENMFNDPAPEGQVYVLVNVTTTYNGTNGDGDSVTTRIEYVTVEGNTRNSSDTFAVVPDELDFLATLYQGASETGNVVFAVPADTAALGVLAVRPHTLGDKVFVAMQ